MFSAVWAGFSFKAPPSCTWRRFRPGHRAPRSEPPATPKVIATASLLCHFLPNQIALLQVVPRFYVYICIRMYIDVTKFYYILIWYHIYSIWYIILYTWIWNIDLWTIFEPTLKLASPRCMFQSHLQGIITAPQARTRPFRGNHHS